MADNIVQEVNSPNILVITDSDQNQITVTQPLTNTIEVATPGPQGTVGPTGPVGSSAPFTKITGSDSWFTTSSIQVTGSLVVSGSSTFINIGPAIFTGSVQSTQGFTGSLQGSSSYAVQSLSSSYALTAGTYLYVGNTSANTSINWSRATVQELNLDNDPTLTFVSGTQGQTYNLLLKQQLGGQRVVTWPSSVIWSGGTTASFASLTSVVIDTDFNTGAGFGNTVNIFATQSDGKILAGGIFQSYSGSAVNRIVRINPSGTLDTSFNIGTGFNDQVLSLAIQPDGKILTGGQFTQYSGTSSFYIARLNADGTRDANFNVGTGFNGGQNTFAVQQDGKVIAGGQWSSYNGTAINRIIRLTDSGSRDTSFNVGTGFNNNVNTVIIQADSKVLVGGQFTSYSGSTVNRLVRLDISGSIDTSFNVGTGFDNTVNALVIQPDGKILVAGNFTTYSGSSANRTVRLNTNGTIDTSFNAGVGANNTISTMALQPDGKIIIGGSFNQVNSIFAYRIARLNASGSLDNTFNTNNGFGNTVNTVVRQSDGKLLVGGFFTTFNGATAALGVRLKEISPLGYNNIVFTYNGTYYIGLI